MSMFEDDQYCWRETYFVLFDSARRPSLKAVQDVLGKLGGRLTLVNGVAGEAGEFESITVLAPDDFAAVDISYLAGDEVREQGTDLAREMEQSGDAEGRKDQLARLRRYDGRFDVLHFEQLVGNDEEDDPDGMLDPTTLLSVLETLARLTDGIAVDPQAGTVL